MSSINALQTHVPTKYRQLEDATGIPHLAQLHRRCVRVGKALHQRREIAGHAVGLAVRILRRLCASHITKVSARCCSQSL